MPPARVSSLPFPLPPAVGRISVGDRLCPPAARRSLSWPAQRAIPGGGHPRRPCPSVLPPRYLSGRAPEQCDDISPGAAMNDTLCESFFLQPTQPLHRRYEVLRAAFVEHRPLQDVARQYGYRYGSLRNLVARFRAQCQRGQVPPFSPRRRAAGPTTPARRARSRRPSLTVAPSPSPRGATCAAAPPACSCSCHCWRSSAWTPWSLRPATPGPKWSQLPRPCSACWR